MTSKSIRNIVRVLTIVCAICMCSACSSPSDEALLKNWRAKEDKFNDLVTLFGKEKALLRVYADGDLDNGLKVSTSGKPDPATILKIRDLLKELNLIAIDRSEYSSDITYEMIASSFGSFDEGESKGFIYTECRVPNLRPSLDGIKRDETAVYHRPIKGNWFLYLDVSR